MKQIKYFLAFLLWVMISYAAMAFLELDINPMYWSLFSRIVLICLIGIFFHATKEVYRSDKK